MGRISLYLLYRRKLCLHVLDVMDYANLVTITTSGLIPTTSQTVIQTGTAIMRTLINLGSSTRASSSATATQASSGSHVKSTFSMLFGVVLIALGVLMA